ncbi:septum formation initiator family protein [Candidatus Eisenbacteria bacterium]|uniref:Septum formation initiator family protein n=1 Tax=Eiseniibacteriota bacterium TaxID=2212470 RepID=A0ABV6YK46_UNCEI
MRGSSLSSENLFLRKIWRSSRQQWRRFALVGILLWTAYSLVLSPGGAIHLLRLRGLEAEIEREIEAYEGKRDSLDRVLMAIDAGDAFQYEKVARERFGFAYPNDRVYMLPNHPQDRLSLSLAARHGAETFSERGKGGPEPASQSDAEAAGGNSNSPGR